MRSLDGKTVGIIGLGASGVAAARLALAKGGDVYVSDLRTEPAVAARGADLRAAGARIELGGHDLERLAGADLVVVSPGIPPHAPVLGALADRGVRWVSEPELAVRFFSGSLIAITGTNGKTTTALLVGRLLEAAGIRAAVGGNVGGGLAPAASELALRPDPPAWYVLEMSSFQLADLETFRADIGVVTNLSPDHMDRYASLEAYYADKACLFDRATPRSRWVLPARDESVAELAGDAPGERFYFDDRGDEADHAFVAQDDIVLRTNTDTDAVLPVGELPLLGRHNVRNALAAALTARLAGASIEGIARGLREAAPLPHRLEPVLERDGVLWVNDSKATNVAAARSALESLARPVVLLLGGKDKGEDFGALLSGIATVRAVLAYGAAGDRIAAEIADAERVDGDFEAVLRRAAELARPGDAVLLSPGCSSFDMFDDYEHRGRRFAELAREVA